MRVLVLNAGSSSLKVSVLGPDDALDFDRTVELGGRPLTTGRVAAALLEALDGGRSVDAVGHRVVHGGPDRHGAVLIDPAVREELAGLVPLAPLHQPAALLGIDAAARLLPDVPAVACFDTAFHRDLPAAASTYALPAGWRERYGLRRYGFHGLSHAYASRRAAQLLAAQDRPAARVVTCHLGAGASLAAVLEGRSVDTTMGFTPLDGLVMATRPGSVDPGMLTWLLGRDGIDAEVLNDGLVHGSGLLGLTGTADMRQVLERAGAGDTAAGLGLEVYLHRLRAGIAAMAAAMDGLDALVFTGGVGERSPAVRERAAAGLAFLGVAVDPAANTSAGEGDISAPGAAAVTLVTAAREDLEIAAETRAVLGAPPGEPPPAPPPR